MKLFTFSLLVIATVFILGCAENRFDIVLDELDRPTYEVVGEVAGCYDYLLGDLTQYYIALDKVCVDLLVTRKTLEELTVDTTISTILSDTDTYHAEYVELEAFVIAVEDEGSVTVSKNRYIS